jgi:hypothetical protein
MLKKEFSTIEMIWLGSLQLLTQNNKRLQKLRDMSDRAAQKWIKNHKITFEKTVDTYEAAVRCADILNNLFSDTIVFEVTKFGETIRIRMQSQPIYNSIYMNAKKSGIKIFPLDAPIFVNALKNMTGREFRSQMVEFNNMEEVIDLLPLEVGLNVLISVKMTKGTIKINETDSNELGLGIIDKVSIRHEKTGNTFIGMSYSSSKVPKGTVFISISDARAIGYNEGDKIRIEKAEKEAAEELVSIEEYNTKE